MTRKRFIKLAMAETDKRTAVFAANIALDMYRNYQIAYNKMDGIIGGRFEEYTGGKQHHIRSTLNNPITTSKMLSIIRKCYDDMTKRK